MREIKFRQYDTRRKLMHYGIGASEGTWAGFPYVNWEYYPIMQYTGLKDMNGKEIYEGDLVVNSSRNDGKPHSVEWDNSQGGWVGNYRLRYLLGQESVGVEVIGNIYENPELLDGK